MTITSAISRWACAAAAHSPLPYVHGRRWSMLANTGSAVVRKKGPPLILDLSGAIFAQRLALLWDHGAQIGVSTSVSLTDRGIEASGHLMLSSEQAYHVALEVDAGRALKASLQATALRMEMLADGQVEMVNGRMVTGPARIYRHWQIDELSVLTDPADRNTWFALSPANDACRTAHTEDQAAWPRRTSHAGRPAWSDSNHRRC